MALLVVVEIMEQIACFIGKSASIIPSECVKPLARSLTRATRSQLNYINRMYRKGYIQELKEQISILQKIQSIASDFKFQTLLASMAAFLQQVQVKIQSCSGSFRDIFIGFVSVRDHLKQLVGDVCGTSLGTELSSGK